MNVTGGNDLIGAGDGAVLDREEERVRHYCHVLSKASQPFASGFLDGRLNFVNQAFVELTGYTEKELESRSWDVDLTPEEWRESEAEELRKLLQDDEPRSYEKEYIRKDGRRIPIEVKVHLVRSEDDRPAHYFAFVTDISGRKAAEQAGIETENRFRSVLENALDAAYRRDLLKDCYDYISPVVKDVMGIPAGQLQDMPVDEFFARVHADDVPNVLRSLEDSRNGSKGRVEYRFRGNDGRYRWIADNFFVQCAPDGTPLYRGGIVRDITSRKKEEQALRAQQHMLQIALDAASMGTWRYHLHDHRWELNEKAQELYGLHSAEVVHDEEGVREVLHPDDIPAMWMAVQRAADPKGDGKYFAEYRVAAPGGSWRWLSVWGLMEFEGEGADRKPVMLTGASRDISDRKRNELLLAAQKRALEMVVQGKPIGSILEYLTEVATSQSDSSTISSVLLFDENGCLRHGAAPDLPDEYNNAIDGLKASKDLGTCSVAAVTGEVVMTPDIANDPKWSTIKHLPLDLGLKAAWSHPIKTGDGKVIGTFGTYFRECRRPTGHEQKVVALLAQTAALALEHRRAENSLRESDRRKDEFLAILAHELRNPLAPIRTGLELLQLGAGDPDLVQDTREMMERQTLQMVRMIDDLLDVSRISRDKLELRLRPVLFNDVIRDSVEASRPLIIGKSQNLEIHVPATEIWLNADGNRLAQVFSNLLNNASKFTPEGGNIHIHATVNDDRINVTVKDDGNGIPPEMLGRIFEMFQQVEGNGEQMKQGLGIGLTLARRLVEMHGGNIRVTSEGTGKGSSFTVELPIGRDIVPAQEDHAGTDRDRAARKLCIVVADDNEAATETLSMVMRMLGHEVHPAYDGMQAVEITQRVKPDVVLMDIGMPRKNGYDAARDIRKIHGGDRMLLVALTGWGSEEDMQRTKEAGFDHHITKPAEPAVLKKILAGV
jgi:PAS domain S-box-containing protein